MVSMASGLGPSQVAEKALGIWSGPIQGGTKTWTAKKNWVLLRSRLHSIFDAKALLLGGDWNHGFL